MVHRPQPVPTYDYRIEALGGASFGWFGGDEGSLGSGPGFVGGVGIRLWPGVAVEFDVSGISHERDFVSGVRFEGTARVVSGHLTYFFSDGQVQPYATGGVGVLHSDRTSRFPGDPPLDFTDNEFGFSYGGGIKVFVNERVSLRPQFRVFHSPVTGLLGWRSGSVAVGYHW